MAQALPLIFSGLGAAASTVGTIASIDSANKSRDLAKEQMAQQNAQAKKLEDEAKKKRDEENRLLAMSAARSDATQRAISSGNTVLSSPLGSFVGSMGQGKTLLGS